MADGLTVSLETHGCKLNQADTQSLARELASAGYSVSGSAEDADVYVLNTCTVTHVADRKARQAVRAAKRRNPNSLVVVTGCYAQRAPDDLRSMPEIDLVVGNVDKPSLARMIGGLASDPDSACAIGDDMALSQVLRIRSRAMVKIQEGCDQVCAYCIVPTVRGRERSIPVDEIVDTANSYADMGCQEVVLTGTQLGSYGFDLENMNIAGLVRNLLERTELPRIRISSLQPQDISDELLELWEDPRLCPHFHVPLQSGSDAILKTMRRRYTSAEFQRSVRRVKEAGSGRRGDRRRNSRISRRDGERFPGQRGRLRSGRTRVRARFPVFHKARHQRGVFRRPGGPIGEVQAGEGAWRADGQARAPVPGGVGRADEAYSLGEG